jgi:hypothetical protein
LGPLFLLFFFFSFLFYFFFSFLSWAYRAGGGGEGAGSLPQFVGQTKPVGQYSLHSLAILAYYKNKWDKFCQFCGKYV